MTDRERGWISGRLPGVLHRRLVTHTDSRGSFTELWRSSWASEMAQANVSRSSANVLRGLHFHRRQSDLWIVLEGRAFVALVDLRAAIPEAGHPPTETLELGVSDALFLPPMVAHGFLALEPLMLVYLVTQEYDGTDELGFAWDDSLAAIDWPDQSPIVSERDAANPNLLDALASLQDPQQPLER